jgi:DNA-binding transcriptional MerR regulator
MAPETIRRYEKMGMVTSVRDSAGYRYFGISDFHVFMQARMYRSLGFTLKETAALLDSKNMDAVAVLLQEREKALKEELAWRRYVLKYLRRYTKHIRELANFENRITVTERPALYGLLYRRDQRMNRDPQLRKTVNAWMKYMPLPLPLLHYEDSNAEWVHRYSMGLCLTRQDAEFLRIKPNTHVFNIDPCPCVYTVARAAGGGHAKDAVHDHMPALMQKISRQGLAYSGSIYGRVFPPLDCSGYRHAYFEYWIPCQQR